MSDAQTTDDEPIKTIESRRIDPAGRVRLKPDTYAVGTVLDVIVNGPADAVAISDAEVKSCGELQNAINIPHNRFDIYDIEEGQTVDVEVMEVIRRAE